MGISAIILAAVTAFFAIRGYFHGLARSLARTLSFVGAYGAAFFFSVQTADLLKTHTPVDGFASYIVGSLAIFFGALIILRLIFRALIKLSPSQGQTPPNKASRIAGLTVGALVGAFIGLLLVYTFSLYESAKERQAGPLVDDTRDPVADMARRTVSESAGQILQLTGASEGTLSLSEALIYDPLAGVERVSRVVENPDLNTLLRDRRAQRLMQRGDIDELMKVPAFERLMQDPDMQQLLADAGMDMNERDDAHETAEKIALGWQQIQLMQTDPRVQAIVEDPEFRRQLQAGNKLPLLMNPKLNELAAIIFVEGASKVKAVQADSEITIREVKKGADQLPTEDNGEGTTVYRRIDDDGNVYYSDRPVD